MKTLKSFLMPVIIFAFVFPGFVTRPALCHDAELIFFNTSYSRQIAVHVYPISMIFNGNNEYDLHSRYSTQYYHYNIGKGTGQYYFIVPPNSEVAKINHDANGATGGNSASVGFGKYKIIVSWNTGQDTCTAEWDYGYSFPSQYFSGDLTIFFRDDNNNPRVTFQWSGNPEVPITYVNKEIVAWNQLGRIRREKNYGNFIYDNSFGNTYNIFPQDSRRDCGVENQSFDDNRSGVMTQNLTIDKNVFTPGISDLFDFPTNVIVNPSVTLKLNSDRTLDFTEIIPYYTGGEFRMTVRTQGNLTLNNSAQIIIRNHNWLTLESGSYLTLNTGSEIRIKQGGIFCNQGAYIIGPGHIIYEGGIHYQCAATADLPVSGGADISLESDAVLEIPDNATLHFKDNNTSLTMSDDSRILLGKNSKIVFENGSRIISNENDNVFNLSKTYQNSEGKQVQLDRETLLQKLSEKSEYAAEENSAERFTLNQNMPNPFNPTTVINYRIPNDNFVTLKIFDVAGKEVETLVNNFQKAGNYNVTFDGSSISSGIYYYKIVSGDFVSIRKMILIK